MTTAATTPTRRSMPGVADLLAGYADGTISPRDAVEDCLATIAATEPELGAVVTLLADRARAAADEAGRRWRAGTARPLEGVPYGLKDTIDTAGVPTEYGSALYRGHVPAADAEVHRRLTEAGGVLLAKLATYEFEAGKNDRTRNPFDLTRNSGGSSSGPCASVGAGQLPLAIGSDAGGSIRVPAAWCGAVGLKPTYGRISRRGAVSCSWTLGHLGPITRSTRDAALALNVLAGHDPLDPYSVDAPVDADYAARLDGDITGMRIGVPQEWFEEVCEPAIAAAVTAARDELARAGATLVPVSLPLLRRINPDALKHLIVPAEAASMHEGHLTRIGEFDEAFRGLLLEGQLVAAPDYLRALRMRALIQHELAAVFASVDALATPGSVITAPLLEQETVTLGGQTYPLAAVVARTTSVFNLAGNPSVVVPCGSDDHGLPISLQIATAPWREADCLRIAHAFEARR
ncbi:amidase [Dactylosporangium sucinum]|uniref:Glutamyl-tRNA(Gln) amidotransferase subunit A n=1 Tax=Dactylosporangium sucinum TaxID=1424081 RepID=A0A917TWY5_9ACTN|nr:amidase [Dactylosporangium sucinum]GGM40180.1 glutamyl-tRNA(Gln) amidotransferase subunit A [Dactylosporangium sucinum]